jgi:hypothetical protein
MQIFAIAYYSINGVRQDRMNVVNEHRGAERISLTNTMDIVLVFVSTVISVLSSKG